MLGVPPLGSVVDVATFVLVSVKIVYDYRPRLRDVGAGLVAVAEQLPHVDDDAIQSDLDVERRDVDAYLTDGGHPDE